MKGGVKYVYIESEPCMEIEDEEKTCLIPNKIEGEQFKARLYIALTFTSLPLWLKHFYFKWEEIVYLS